MDNLNSGDLQIDVTVSPDAGAAAAGGVATVTSEAIVIPNRAGLHARPAAVLAHKIGRAHV